MIIVAARPKATLRISLKQIKISAGKRARPKKFVKSTKTKTTRRKS